MSEVDEVDGPVEGGGSEESSTIRQMRQALKEAQGRVRDLEARLEGSVSGDEAASLRSRSEGAVRSLAEERWGRIVGEFGVPPRLAELVRGQVSEQQLCDDVEGVRGLVAEVVEEMGSHRMPRATADRMAAQAAMDDAYRSVQPAAAGGMTYEEFQAVRDRSPREAQALLARGEVELPDHVAQQMSSNRKGLFG